MSTSKKANSSLKNELSDLAKILTGEMEIRNNQEKLEALKKDAIESQKKKLRKGIKDGSVTLEEDDEPRKKVVQNIKLFEWESPIRIAFSFEKKNFLFIVAICLVFILFLAILGHFALMFAIIALLFLIYVAGTTDPVKVKHAITARGVQTMEALYDWEMLENFWFANKKGQDLLIVETKLRFPVRLIMLIEEKDRNSLFILLQDKLLYRDVKKQGRWEKMNYGDYIPLEKV